VPATALLDITHLDLAYTPSVESGDGQSLALVGQVAVSVLVHVQHVAVQNEPDVFLRPRPEGE
jgi:hypothetical protein